MRKFLVSAILLTIPTTLLAEPEDVAAARRGYFQLIGLEMGSLAAMAKGEIAYDADAAQAHAADIRTLSEYLHDDILAVGTSNAGLPGKTRALPKIWDDMTGYGEKAAAFKEAAANMASVAGGGKEAMAPAVGQLGGTCKGCHDTYRAKDF